MIPVYGNEHLNKALNGLLNMWLCITFYLCVKKADSPLQISDTPLARFELVQLASLNDKCAVEKAARYKALRILLYKAFDVFFRLITKSEITYALVLCAQCQLIVNKGILYLNCDANQRFRICLNSLRHFIFFYSDTKFYNHLHNIWN